MANFMRTEADAAPLDELFKPFSTIGRDWMLITAGSGTSRDEWNTMTASWGSFGVFWNKRAVTCVIRPTRHTFRFVEREGLVTFSFFDPPMKGALQVCGSASGRDTDKAAAAGLTPVELEPGAIGFPEARVNLVCRKLFAQDINPDSFIDPAIEKNYPDKDYHRMYVCEILRVYQNGAR
jgi:flavin reductase (DIM6/NTAB) family NADH-FMN oxidoreductase RutF